MDRIVLLCNFHRAFDPHADSRNVAMIKRRHAFWTHLARACSWQLGIANASALTVSPQELRRMLEHELTQRRTMVEQAIGKLGPLLLAADLPLNYVADIAFVRGNEPVVLELNPLYAAGYNVPAVHALMVTALGANLAQRAGYPVLEWGEMLDIAEVLMGERVERSPAVWIRGE